MTLLTLTLGSRQAGPIDGEPHTLVTQSQGKSWLVKSEDPAPKKGWSRPSLVALKLNTDETTNLDTTMASSGAFLAMSDDYYW